MVQWIALISSRRNWDWYLVVATFFSLSAFFPFLFIFFKSMSIFFHFAKNIISNHTVISMWEANDKNTAFSFLFLLLKTREILIIPEYSSLILSSFVVRCPIWMGKVCIRGLKILKCEIAYWLKPFACRLNFSPLFLLQWNFWIWDSKTNQSIMKQLFFVLHLISCGSDTRLLQQNKKQSSRIPDCFKQWL